MQNTVFFVEKVSICKLAFSCGSLLLNKVHSVYVFSKLLESTVAIFPITKTLALPLECKLEDLTQVECESMMSNKCKITSEYHSFVVIMQPIINLNFSTCMRSYP